MEISIFLAKAFSIYFLVMSAAMLIRPNHFKKAAIEMTRHPGIDLLSSILTLILGIILVLSHDIWKGDWRIIISILAWLTLIKGIVRLLFPANVKNWLNAINNQAFYYSSIFFMILLGLYLAYVGFYS